jgi:hypothetical protein
MVMMGKGSDYSSEIFGGKRRWHSRVDQHSGGDEKKICKNFKIIKKTYIMAIQINFYKLENNIKYSQL